MRTTIRLVILSLAFLFGMVRAQVTELPIGGLDQVMKWSLENSVGLLVQIKQGNILVGKVTVGQSFPKLNSKEELDSLFTKNLLIAASAAVNDDRGQNKNQPFTVYAKVEKYYYEERQKVNFFICEGEFSLIRMGDGSYKLPDLSWMKLEFPSLGIPVLIPDLKWARMDTSEAIYDSALSNSDPQIVWYSKVLVIPLDVAMGSDATVRIIHGTNYTYQVFGPDGKPQAEEPVRLILGSYPTGTSQAKKASWGDGVKSIEVQGGGVGRVLQLQQANTPQGPWLDIEDGEFTRWSSEPYFKSVETTTDINFYRVRSVKKIPTY